MIYQTNNNFYVKQGDKYFLAHIEAKNHTVIVSNSDEYVTELEDVKEISYKELKEIILNEEATDEVVSLNSCEV